LDTIYDPLRREIDLPLTGVFFPLGFRAEISTNSEHVLRAAAESYDACAAEFESRPIQLRIAVEPAGPRAAAPVFRSQRHFFSIVSDRDNFAFYDSRSMFGYCFVSENTAADRSWFRFHFLDTMCYMLLAQECIMPVEAACVAYEGSGVLLCGRSGAGKSTLAWACARAGWTYITDDGASLLLADIPDRQDPPPAPLALGRCRHVRLREDAATLFPESARYAARSLPGGKRAIEIPLADFPRIRSSSRAPIGATIVLDHRPVDRAALESIDPAGVASMLLRDVPWYGDEVHTRYRRVVDRLVQGPVWRLAYTDLAQAVDVLTALALSLNASRR
jgi:hypothetical protein